MLLFVHISEIADKKLLPVGFSCWYEAEKAS